MTKKYRLLIDSPEYTKGTIISKKPTHNLYYVDGNTPDTGPCFRPEAVENRPTIWHEITEPEPKQSFKSWRAKNGCGYWYISGYGDIFLYTEQNNDRSDYRYLTGNYFQTREEAEAYKARQEAIGRVTHAIIEANEGKRGNYAIVWRNGKYDTLLVDYEPHNTAVPLSMPPVLSEDIALSIISSHKEDLDLIFNLKK